jgi:hypothetical protein
MKVVDDGVFLSQIEFGCPFMRFVPLGGTAGLGMECSFQVAPPEAF